MDAALIAAGSLGLAGAAIHGVAGELLVVRRLSADRLPATRFGGPRATMTMIHVTWHTTTAAFVTVACALLLAGTVLDGDAARGVALVAAAAASSFAAIALVLGGAALSPRGLLRHPGPLMLTSVAVLAWVGAL
ncbi:MAG TPA: hypothetical protein VJT75_05910 [Thermoleophilaceae bacterium]|nr:hypothetical protein [Thermoleophilaceae bacterium]